MPNTYKDYIGVLILVILMTGIIYITLPGKVKIRVDEDKSTLYVLNENNRWVVGGREYSKLLDGTKRLYRDASHISIWNYTDFADNTTEIFRRTPYKRGPSIVETWSFDGKLTDIDQVPTGHKIEIYNGKGYFYRYEVRDLTYSGPTFKLDGNQIIMGFERNIKVTWWPGYRLGWVYKTGSMYVKSEKLDSDYEVFNVRLFDPNNLYLDGVDANRSYEYGETVNLTTDQARISIYDNTFRYLEMALSSFFYNLTLIRNNRFNDDTTSKSVASGGTGTIGLSSDNEYYNASINISGSSSPTDAIINFTSDIYIFPGTLLGVDLYQDEFIYLGTSYSTKNISFSSAGSAVIYVNFSCTGNLSRSGFLNLTLTAYDLDSGNDLDIIEEYLNSTYFGITVGVDGIMSAFDDFESVTPSRWECTNISGTPSSYSCVQTTGNNDDYFNFAVGTNWGGFSSSSAATRLDYVAPEITLENISKFNITYDWACGWSRQNGHSSSFSLAFKVTDSTDEVSLFSESCSGSGSGGGSSGGNGLILWGVRNPDNTWDIYSNATLKANDVSLASLTSPKSLRWSISVSGNAGGEPGSGSSSGELKLYNFNTSGIRIHRNDGEYNDTHGGVYESTNLTTTPNNIGRAIISEITVYNPANTDIDWFLSADNGTNYEVANPGEYHSFTNTGTSLKVKIILNTTDNLTSPFVPRFRIQIVPAAPSSLTIDVGNDGIDDMIADYELNSTTTPLSYNGSDAPFNAYINRSCSGVSHIAVPISLILGSGGTIQVSDTNATQDINPVTLTVANFANYSQIDIKPVYTGGAITFYGIKHDYVGDANITASGHSADFTTTINRTIIVKRTKFNDSLPYTWTTAIMPLPKKINDTNVTPFGQSTTVPIFNITNLRTYHGFDLGVKINETIGCVNITMSNVSNRSRSFSQLLNATTYGTLCTNLTTGYCGLWMWIDYNGCNASEVRYYRIQLNKKSCCSGCVTCSGFK